MPGCSLFHCVFLHTNCLKIAICTSRNGCSAYDMLRRHLCLRDVFDNGHDRRSFRFYVRGCHDISFFQKGIIVCHPICCWPPCHKSIQVKNNDRIMHMYISICIIICRGNTEICISYINAVRTIVSIPVVCLSGGKRDP